MASVVSGLLLGLSLLAADPQAAAAAPDPREAELATIRQEIGQLKTRLDAMRQRETGLAGEVERSRVELQLQETQLAEATAAHALAAAQATAAETRISELEVRLARVRRQLRERLAGLYRLGRYGYLSLFFALKSDDNLLPAIRQLRFLVRRDQLAIERYTATRHELDAERLHLDAVRRDTELWQQAEETRRTELVALRRRQEQLLERMTTERERLAARTSELEDKERKLARLIDSLVSSEGAAQLAGQPIQEFHGVLDWPLTGRVSAGFGTRRDPRYRTEVPHNGIDIALPAPAEVRAVYPGQVLFADRFEGYGRMVVVHHPRRVFTLYAGLRELRVNKGDMLSLGTVLGTAAETLYFEIRRENQPEDPLAWLR